MIRKPAPRPIPPSERWPKRHEIKPGDSLRTLAKQYYGDGKKFRVLANANRKLLAGSRIIYPCQRIAIPRVRA